MTDAEPGLPIFGIPAHATATPDRAALIAGDRTETYAELADRAGRLAAGLLARGVREGDRLALMVPNGLEYFELTHAASRIPCGVIPVNWHLKAEELRWILSDSGARMVVAHASLLEQVDAARAELPGCELLVVGDDSEDGYEAVIATASDALAPRAVAAAAGTMFYTSGTSGRPKGVEHDGSVNVAPLFEQAELFGIRPQDVHLLAAPAYHAAPGGWANFYLSLGGTVVVLERWNARAWLAAVERYRVETAFVVPSHLVRLLEVPEEERRRYDLSSLRSVFHAGEPCPVPVKRRAIDALPRTQLWEYYGGSESGTATCISKEEWLAHPGSVGRPLSGIDVQVLGPDGDPVPTGELGTIYYTPWGHPRYRHDPEKTTAAWDGELFTLGDLGYLDEDGYLYLSDRRDDLILRGGVNVYPREVEEVLHRHGAVVDCAVLGIPDPRLGQLVAAVVETREPVTEDALIDHCRRYLADFKCPAVVELVDALPRDLSGKVRRRELRDRFARAAGLDPA